MTDLQSFFLAFAAAAAGVIVLTPFAKRLAFRVNAVSQPKADRWNDKPVPLLGGVALYGAAIGAGTLVHGLGGLVLPVVLAGSAMFALGLVDDLMPLKPSTKLTAQIAIACAVLTAGVVLDWTESAVVNALLTIVWIVGITNAFNLLDNMDGLCAGIAAIAGIAFASSIGFAEPGLVRYAGLLGGAGAAFLVFNFKPASIFMGDSGSLFIGSSFAVLAIVSEHNAQSGLLSSVAVPALLLLIPIFDTAFVTVSRKLSARSASTGGRDHTSHRLVALGFSESQAVLILYGLAAAAAATAVGLAHAHVLEARVALPLLVVGLVLLGVQLARVNVYGGGQDFSLLRNRAYTPLLVDVAYKRRLFEVILDLCLICIAYYGSYIVRFDRDFPLYYDLLVKSLPIVIACHLSSFFIVGVYRGLWRYVSAHDFIVYAKGVAMGSVASVLALVYLYRFEGYSRGVFIINAMALGLLVVGSRISFRLVADAADRRLKSRAPVIIYGAGDAGVVTVRELRNNPSYGYRPTGFVDDDPGKARKRVLDVPVLGGGNDLEEILAVWKPQALIVSTAKLTPARLSGVRRACEQAGVPILRLRFGLEPLRPEIGPAVVTPIRR
jgi:UDP-GlcNAc:undecaprenyl-phosphate GlcNAc-1-phosphate transferase